MSLMLSDAQVERMRSVANRALPDSGTGRRLSAHDDGLGAADQSPTITVQDCPCRIAPPPRDVRLDQWQDKIMNRTAYILTVAFETDIQSGDEWEITAGEMAGTYRIVGALVGSWAITDRYVVVGL